MNSKGDEKLKALSELSVKNNLTIIFLKKQISLGRLQFEKKGNSFYSTQSWIEEFRKNFTFSGFMFDRLYFKKNIQKPPASKENPPKKSSGKIIKEEKVNIDIEEALVGKWNNEFRKINNQFDDLIKDSKSPKSKKAKNDFVKNPHNIHSAIIAVAIMFLLSFYTVKLAPNAGEAFTKKIDAIIETPYNYINQLALINIIDEEDVLGIETPDSVQFSNYIKNKISNISYPAGTTLNIAQKDIVGRVAGIEEEYVGEENVKLIDRFKETTIEVFTKISDKQKRASLKLSDKLNDFISSILGVNFITSGYIFFLYEGPPIKIIPFELFIFSRCGDKSSQ